MSERGIRVSVDEASEPLGARIRRAKIEKIPYVLVAGDSDIEAGTIGVNRRGLQDPERDVSVAQFIDEVLIEITHHGIEQ
jgi:threonyl-tRNA synthetase